MCVRVSVILCLFMQVRKRDRDSEGVYVRLTIYRDRMRDRWIDGERKREGKSEREREREK